MDYFCWEFSKKIFHHITSGFCYAKYYPQFQPCQASGSPLNGAGLPRAHTRCCPMADLWYLILLIFTLSVPQESAWAAGPLSGSLPRRGPLCAGPLATLSVLSDWASPALERKLLNNRGPRQRSLVVKGSESGAQTAWTWLRPAPTHISCVTLGKFLNGFIPQFSHL